MKEHYQVSVRFLIEFIKRSGSISNEFKSSIPATTGIKMHQLVQANYPSHVLIEKALRCQYSIKGIDLMIAGRVDGIYLEDIAIIDEIKSTMTDINKVEVNEMHFYQGMVYGYMFLLETKQPEIDVQVTYINVNNKKMRSFKRRYRFEELEKFMDDLVDQYHKWLEFEINHRKEISATLQALEFPFSEYRLNQKAMMTLTYLAIKNSEIGLINAPTGIGKTISTLFPALKALGENLTNKIFYLSAKTITQKVAFDLLLEFKATKIKVIVITSKDRSCFLEKPNCHPTYCRYALNHFDRVNDVIYEMINTHCYFSYEVIKDYALKYEVCPFELLLDVSLFCDVVIMDYNYAFDPRASLKRYFEQDSRFVLLTDEAHNLHNRAKEMYSATLDRNKFLELKISKRNKKLNTAIARIVACFNEYQPELTFYHENDLNLLTLLNEFLPLANKYLVKYQNEDLINLYFDTIHYLNMSLLFNKSYVLISENNQLTQYCLDPKLNLYQKMKLVKSVIFFSATLLPVNYFVERLSISSDKYVLNLPSPFDSKNRLLMSVDLKTTYRHRTQTNQSIVEYLKIFTTQKQGNYLIFFPSYEYMNQIYQLMNDERIIVQPRTMNDIQKNEFVLQFEKHRDLVVFSVLGSHFNEGIDLKDDLLIGVAIISVALPQISPLKDLEKDYYNQLNMNGFDYSYTYPGFSKVLQAVGRCIRTDHDRGMILLIDHRYETYHYQQMYPKNWDNMIAIKNHDQFKQLIDNFWKYHQKAT